MLSAGMPSHIDGVLSLFQKNGKFSTFKKKRQIVKDVRDERESNFVRIVEC